MDQHNRLWPVDCMCRVCGYNSGLRVSRCVECGSYLLRSINIFSHWPYFRSSAWHTEKRRAATIINTAIYSSSFSLIVAVALGGVMHATGIHNTAMLFLLEVLLEATALVPFVIASFITLIVIIQSLDRKAKISSMSCKILLRTCLLWLVLSAPVFMYLTSMTTEIRSITMCIGLLFHAYYIYYFSIRASLGTMRTFRRRKIVRRSLVVLLIHGTLIIAVVNGMWLALLALLFYPNISAYAWHSLLLSIPSRAKR